MGVCGCGCGGWAIDKRVGVEGGGDRQVGGCGGGDDMCVTSDMWRG